MPYESEKDQKPDLSFAEQEELEKRQNEWNKEGLTPLEQAIKDRWEETGLDQKLPPKSFVKKLEGYAGVTTGSHELYELISFNPDKAVSIMKALADTDEWDLLEEMNLMSSNHEWGMGYNNEGKEKAAKINKAMQQEYKNLIELKPTTTETIKKGAGALGRKIKNKLSI